jgi:uncharacterized protein (DUF779 family)
VIPSVTVEVTDAALAVVRLVEAARPGARLVFVFGEGCCEGTAPHLFAQHVVGPDEREVGRAGDVPVLAGERMRTLYAGRRVVIDAEEDALADGFSAEVELGWRFVLRSMPGSGSA